jgi:ribosomal protein L13E
LSKPQRKKQKSKEPIETAEMVGKGAVREAAKAEDVIRREVEGIRRRTKAVETIPTGKIPVAMVVARHGAGTLTRQGKGFSLHELSEAGVEPRLAAKWGVWVDHRRRSTLVENVTSLSGWHSRRGAAPKAVAEVTRVEEEAEKVEKRVENLAEVAKKEVVKVEKSVRKKAKKQGKAVKKKVARPKAKKKKRKS